jgi:hypothetical protein
VVGCGHTQGGQGAVKPYQVTRSGERDTFDYLQRFECAVANGDAMIGGPNSGFSSQENTTVYPELCVGVKHHGIPASTL